MSAKHNSFVVLRQGPKDWGILNIVMISQEPNEHHDAAEARARRDAYKKMAGWSATMPGETLRVEPNLSNSCKPVNNVNGFV